MSSGSACQARVPKGCNSQSPLPLPQPAGVFHALAEEEGALDPLKDIRSCRVCTQEHLTSSFLPTFANLSAEAE